MLLLRHRLALGLMLACGRAALAQAAPPTLNPDTLLNYPFRNRADLAAVHKEALVLAEVIRAGGRFPTGRAIPQSLAPLFERIAAFTSPEAEGTQKLYIEPFAASQDKAIVHLRERCKLAPPKGGAVVRVYASRADMPAPIRELFTETIAGLNYCSRFVAVWVEDKSPQELQDTISHELCHAYTNSILGPEDEEKLPKWFHEGVALWLSDCRDLYVSYLNAQTQQYTYSTAEYKEFRTIFRYIAKEQGDAITDAFIRQAVETRNVDRLLPAMLMVEDYNALRSGATSWGRKQEWLRPQFWRVAAVVVLLVLLWRAIGYFVDRELVRRYGRRPRPVDYEDEDDAELDPAVAASLGTEAEEEQEAFEALMLAALTLRLGGPSGAASARALVDDVTQHDVLSARVRDAAALLQVRIREMEEGLPDDRGGQED